jgi:hypothetical protein
MPLDAFLTTFDPSDLPAASIDPLGFDRSYTGLAEALVPGLTSAGTRPRYLSVLCAGALLAAQHRLTLADGAELRLNGIERLERLWALACTLAWQRDEKLAMPGLRGITYAERQISRITGSVAPANYQLLSRQRPYGAIGIYGSVAVRLRLLQAGSLAPTPGFGAELAAAFLDETKVPASVRAAAAEPSRGAYTVPVEELVTWGRRAYVEARAGARERRILSDAFSFDGRRAEIGALMQATPRKTNETELQQLRRISVNSSPSLARLIHVVAAYERCFQLSVHGLQRVLLLADRLHDAPLAALSMDPSLVQAASAMPKAVQTLGRARKRLAGTAAAPEPGSLDEIDVALRALAESDRPETFGLELLRRHKRVQDGKRKGVWAEARAGAIRRCGGPDPRDVTDDAAASHPYRTTAVSGFLALGVMP